jgi:hypothetical protein
MLHLLAGFALSTSITPLSQQAQTLGDRCENVQELQRLAGGESLYEYINLLDREEHLVHGEEIERAFRSGYEKLSGRNPANPEVTIIGGFFEYGMWLAEAYIAPARIPSRERQSLIQKQLRFLPMDPTLSADEVSPSRFTGCGTGLPSRDALMNLMALELNLARQLITTSKQKCALLPLYYRADSNAVNVLLPTLAQDSAAVVRSYALFLMRVQKQVNDRQLIKKLSKDPSAEVRWRMLDILVGLDPNFSKPIVLEMLQDKVEVVRTTAKRALEMLSTEP